MITPPGPFKNSAWNAEKEKYGFRLGGKFIPEMMEYEYVLYKPLDMWPDLEVWLRDMSFKKVLEVSQAMRNEVQNGLGIPTDLRDEHFLMMASAGIEGREAVMDFKLNVMLDLISCSYGYIDRIGTKVSARSAQLAESNVHATHVVAYSSQESCPVIECSQADDCSLLREFDRTPTPASNL